MKTSRRIKIKNKLATLLSKLNPWSKRSAGPPAGPATPVTTAVASRTTATSAKQHDFAVLQPDVSGTASSLLPSLSRTPTPGIVTPTLAVKSSPTRQHDAATVDDHDQEKMTVSDVAAVNTAVANVQSIPESTGESDSRFWDAALKNLQSKDEAAYNKLVERRRKDDGLADNVFKGLKKCFETYLTNHEASTPGKRRDFVATEKVVINLAAFEPTKAAAFVLRTFYYVFSVSIGLSDLQHNIVEYEAKVTHIIRTCDRDSKKHLAKIRHTSSDRNYVESSLIELYEWILKLEVWLGDICHESDLKSAFSSEANASRLKELQASIADSESRWKSDLDDFKNTEVEHEKICDWISERPKPDLATMCERVSLKDFPECGQWLVDMESYKLWEVGDLAVLWIEGTIGTGKTSLMTRIIQRHQTEVSTRNGRRFAYFYCTNSDQSSTLAVLRSILRQLVYDPEDGNLVHEAYKMYNVRDRPDFNTIEQCTQLFASVLDAGVKVRIFIDALDESQDWKDLLNTLWSMAGPACTTGKFQLFLTGQAYARVNEKFSMARNINITKDKTRWEMRHYVSKRIESCPTDERPVKGTCPELEKRLVDTLCNKADGMFLWAKLQLTFFLNAKPPITLPQDFHQHIENLEDLLVNASSLKDIYAKILVRNSGAGTYARKTAEFILQWMICTFRPLDEALLTQTLAVTNLSPKEQPGQETYPKVKPAQYLPLVQDLVLSGAGGSLVFTHSTVREYLQEIHKAVYSNYACHARIAAVCLDFLTKPRQVTGRYIRSIQDPERLKYMFHHTATKENWGLYAFNNFGEHYKASSVEHRREQGIHSLLINWVVEQGCDFQLSDWFEAKIRHDYVIPGELEYMVGLGAFDIAKALLSSSKHEACCKSHRSIYRCLELVKYSRRGRKDLFHLLAELFCDDRQYQTDDMIYSALQTVQEIFRTSIPAEHVDKKVVAELLTIAIRIPAGSYSLYSQALEVAANYHEKEALAQLLQKALSSPFQNGAFLSRALPVALKSKDKEIVGRLMGEIRNHHLEHDYVVLDALAVAVEIRCIDIVKQLLEPATEDVFSGRIYKSLQDLVDRSARPESREKEEHRRIVTLLRKKIESVGCAELDMAAIAGNEQAIIDLLERKLHDLKNLVSAVSHAVNQGHIDVVKLLLDTGKSHGHVLEENMLYVCQEDADRRGYSDMKETLDLYLEYTIQQFKGLERCGKEREKREKRGERESDREFDREFDERDFTKREFPEREREYRETERQYGETER
ncbi:hypothetical protein HBI25_216030 [Parastagonospora nodorum]|nr:hypothetical protein HBH71_130570 [Parastagonospora nodorum]KAH5546571.1 hypothetical protein HBI25_216030 [Parastagonospora nodorum]KAH5678305.1 hypothetical protein HBI23_057240 [Parastagonospora nodorum]KAH6003382.1 hypothetical protein HBI83_200790 [Parastagonospora nodorum]KAH6149144.1 hypothetical protein HBI63_143000 [Parastagonospora nodorum]